MVSMTKTTLLCALLFVVSPTARGQFDSGTFKKGDTVQFQWGAAQVSGTVSAAIGDQLIVRFQDNGKQQSSSLRVRNAKPYNLGDDLATARLKVGDFAQNYLDPALQGKIKTLDGAFATILVPIDGGSEERTSAIDALQRLEAVPEYARQPAGTASTAAFGFREWVDHTGQHKVEAQFVEVQQGKVVLRKADGRQVSLPLSKLSAADQDFVATLDVRFVDFTPPPEMNPISTSVSLNETSAVLAYGRGHHPPIAHFVILDLRSRNVFRRVEVPRLAEGICLATSDDGKKVVTHHQKTLDFDPETKKKSVSWHLTIWNCEGTTALPIQEFSASPSTMFVQKATWLDNQHLFFGQSNGEVKLWKIENGQVTTVYAKTLGQPSAMRVFAISPNGKLFAVENSSKEQIEVYTTRDCKLIRKVPTATSTVETVSLTNSMLLGTTVSGVSVAWDLKKNEMFGQAQPELGRRTHLGSGFASLLPLSHQHALYVRRPFRLANERTIYDFSTARSYGLVSPEVLDVGRGRRIWYPTDDGFGHHRYQAFAIPRNLEGLVSAPGYQK